MLCIMSPLSVLGRLIHKCQGLTVNEIVVDMSYNQVVYQEDQTHVALWHVTTVLKLQVNNYSRQQMKILSDAEVETE